jgi:hypothetical protein
VMVVALRVTMEAISISGKAAVRVEMAVHGGAQRVGSRRGWLPGWERRDWIGSRRTRWRAIERVREMSGRTGGVLSTQVW